MRRIVPVASVVLMCCFFPTLLAATDVSGSITVDTTWTLAGSPYIVTGPVTVNSNITLTIQPGVIVKFNQAMRLDVNGRLLANGTSGSPISFTANQATPTAGFWTYIRYLGPSFGCQMTFATIAYAGRDSSEDTAVLVDGGSPTFSQVTISASGRRGLLVRNAASTPSFTSGTITGSAWEGARVQGGAALTISGSSISNNSYAMTKSAGAQVLGLSGMTISGNGGGTGNGIAHDGGTIAATETWGGGVEWHLPNGVEVGSDVNGSASLSILPGAVVRAGNNRWILVFGTLNAVGSATSPIVFTSLAATPAPGQWAGIRLQSASSPASGQFGFATIANGGGASSHPAALVLDGSSPTLEHVAVRNSSRGGIRARSSSAPVLLNCSFTGNALGAIHNETPSVPVLARATYWGAADGPSGSGPGSGQSVSTGVVYEPWLVDEPATAQYFGQVEPMNRTINPTLQIHHRFYYMLKATAEQQMTYRNSSGVVVRTLEQSGDSGEFEWDGRDESGTLLPNGAYSYEFTSVVEGVGDATPARGPVFVDTALQLAVSGAAIAPPYFSPNGDAIQETTTHSGAFNFDSVNWQVTVRNSSNVTVRSHSGTGPMFSFAWDGRNGSGVLQPDGWYSFEMAATAGSATAGDSRSAVLDTVSPTATISSPTPGQTISNVLQSGSTSFPVTGDASDPNLFDWRVRAQLEPNAWGTLGSGTTSTSGQLALWDTENKPNGTYHLRLEANDLAGNASATQFDVFLGNFNATQSTLQFNSSLGQTVTYSSTIPFTMNEHLRIVDASGTEVKTLFNGSRNAGVYNDVWSGSRNDGNPAADGGYFYLATLTSGASSFTWDLSDQFVGGFSHINDNVVIEPFDPFNNDPMTFVYNFAQPARVTICFSNSNNSIPRHCNPPHYCLKDAVYEESGPHTIEWAGVDETGAMRGDLKNVGVVAFRTEFAMNAVVHYGTKPVVTDLRLDPPVFGPAIGSQQISFDVSTYLNKPVDVTIEYMNQESESVLATLEFSQVQPGEFAEPWDGRASNGMLVAPGAYTMTLTVTDEQGNVLRRRLLTRVQY